MKGIKFHSFILWETNSARMRRVLMTKWTGEEWWDRRENKEFFTKLFEKIGCLMTVDWPGDEKIQPQGLEDCFSKKSFAMLAIIPSCFNVKPSTIHCFLTFVLDPVLRTYTLIAGCTS